MHRITRIALVAATCLPTTLAFAEEISADEARTAVENWLASGAAMGCSKLAAGIVSNVDSYKGSGGTGRFHAVSLRGEDGSKRGYVVTSAETKMTPVIAYSDEGEFVATDDNPLWVLLSGSVKAASDAMVEDAKAVETANAAGGGRLLLKSAAGTANERKWAALLASRRGQEDANALPREYALTKNPSDLRVPALVKTKWGQDTIGGKSGAAVFLSAEFNDVLAFFGAERLQKHRIAFTREWYGGQIFNFPERILQRAGNGEKHNFTCFFEQGQCVRITRTDGETYRFPDGNDAGENVIRSIHLPV